MDAIISVKKDFDLWDSAASRNLCDEKYKRQLSVHPRAPLNGKPR